MCSDYSQTHGSEFLLNQLISWVTSKAQKGKGSWTDPGETFKKASCLVINNQLTFG